MYLKSFLLILYDHHSPDVNFIKVSQASVLSWLIHVVLSLKSNLKDTSISLELQSHNTIKQFFDATQLPAVGPEIQVCYTSSG